WGRSVERLYADSMSFLEGVWEEDREELKQALRGLVNGQPIRGAECRLSRPDGELRWVVCRGFPVFDGHGQIVRLVGSAEDITERKLAEEKLQQSHSRTEAVLEAIHDAYVLIDREWRVAYVNRAAARGIGEANQDTLGRSIWVILADLADSDLGAQC